MLIERVQKYTFYIQKSNFNSLLNKKKLKSSLISVLFANFGAEYQLQT